MEILVSALAFITMLIIWWLWNKNQQLDGKLNIKTNDLELANINVAKLSAELTAIKQQNQAGQDYLKTEFKVLAQELLKSNQDELEQTSAKTLSAVLAPMQTELKLFKDTVELAHKSDIATTAQLKQEFTHLRQSNLVITQEAHNLTQALKGDKQKQGAWGEVILERVLEASGLQQGREFELQQTLTNSDNQRYRPDAIIYLPQDRQIIIDAKTSLNAYKDAINEEEESEKLSFIKQHTANIQAHIDSLSEKKYQYLSDINSLDFVLMFIPIEGALLMALNHSPDLYDRAFKQNIVLVSPSTLQLALRTVEATWRYEKQQENIHQVAERANKMYDKFAGFVEDMEKVGNSLKSAGNHHNNAFKKLKSGKGNLISQAETLKEITGIKPNKQLPNSED